MPPVKNPCVMTSYGGITRIRLKGRSSVTSSQPANTSSPVFISFISIHMILQKTSTLQKISLFYRLKFGNCQNKLLFRQMMILAEEEADLYRKWRTPSHMLVFPKDKHYGEIR